ncbi:MAG: hypothetical protein KBT36_12450 [Kurthia sp.]|nr:hypothetical protein [Candidatus Kurthia equi]
MNVTFAIIAILILVLAFKVLKLIKKAMYRVFGLVATALAIARLYMLIQM